MNMTTTISISRDGHQVTTPVACLYKSEHMALGHNFRTIAIPIAIPPIEGVDIAQVKAYVDSEDESKYDVAVIEPANILAVDFKQNCVFTIVPLDTHMLQVIYTNGVRLACIAEDCPYPDYYRLE